MRKLFFVVLVVALAVSMALPAVAQDEFVFGMVLVGPQNDRGWSQAHYEAGQYVEANLPGARMLVFESLNPADAPETTLLQVATEMVDQGAKLIITSSDAFEEDTDVVAEAFPDVVFINSSGDNAFTGEAPANVGNTMGQMEWGKLIAGCAAGLTTETGSIGYLGPLINGETRRLAASAYLGARHCYETYKGGDPANLTFTVTWIGFWFNIPGVTLDPTEEVNSFFDNGADVAMSGIDTPEVMTVAGQRAGRGEAVHGVAYDYAAGCDISPEICLGVPYFNWGPSYLDIASRVMDGSYTQEWTWFGPDWADLNNPDTSGVGFVVGDGLSEENAQHLDDFIASLAAFAEEHPDENGLPTAIGLWEGPLALQDGTVLAAEGELVMPIEKDNPLTIWYLPQLLEGMVGASE
ncbi:MAG: BMP family ABC transporter substrate-binding protein [Anaerolineae bacterium]|nr:BMP family ABC transporter substrate-binding protein [Anaerolineae bacterium]MCA9909136.1 BMP family ABC transporter substrate-binding protein [Anaerolineae bacterium]